MIAGIASLRSCATDVRLPESFDEGLVCGPGTEQAMPEGHLLDAVQSHWLKQITLTSQHLGCRAVPDVDTFAFPHPAVWRHISKVHLKAFYGAFSGTVRHFHPRSSEGAVWRLRDGVPKGVLSWTVC